MQISHNSLSKRGHKAVLGMLLGMGVGTAVAWLLNGNATVGMGFGMFAGVTPYCLVMLCASGTLIRGMAGVDRNRNVKSAISGAKVGQRVDFHAVPGPLNCMRSA
jgi:hypothetical protein